MRARNLATFATLTLLVCVLFSMTNVIAGKKTVGFDGQVRSLDFSKAVPGQLNYQGYLADAADSSAITATLEMTFRLFDSETKGAELWSETHPAVEVQGGLFQALLGSVTPFPDGLFDGSNMWLQTEVGAEVLAPRKPLVSVAYSQRTEEADHALLADDADQLEGQALMDLDGRWVNEGDLDHLDAADGDPAEAVYVDDAGKVGVGTTSPLTELDVNGSVNAATYYGDGSNLTGISGTADADWTIDGDNVYHETGNVGIGTASPTERLDIDGNMKASGTISSGSSITINGVTHEISSDDTLVILVNGQRSLRIEPNVESPNLVGGHAHNRVTPGVLGATICGGGTIADSNLVTDDYGTIGGGESNQAGDDSGTTDDRPWATVGGGFVNSAIGIASTVGGGAGNRAEGREATVSGGRNNVARGDYAAVGGGYMCEASGDRATVAGGTYEFVTDYVNNEASGYASTVGGGSANHADGDYATIPGGRRNQAAGDYSFAAGRRASASHKGTFVWADSSSTEFSSTGPSQFLIQASGGVGIGTNSPMATLHVDETETADPLRVDVSGSAKFIVKNSGDVGIGTLDPKAQLHLSSTLYVGEASGSNPQISLSDEGSYGRIQSFNGDLLINPLGNEVGIWTTNATHPLTVDGTIAFQQSDQTKYHIWYVNGGLNFVETGVADYRLFIKDGGNIGIGVSNPTYRLQLPDNANESGRGRANQWTTYSSREEKRDIATLEPEDYAAVLEEIAEMDLVYYRYKNQEDDRLYLGVIAEDAPEQVVTSDRKGLSLSEFTAFAMAGLKAQQEQIEALKDEINVLKSQLQNRR